MDYLHLPTTVRDVETKEQGMFFFLQCPIPQYTILSTNKCVDYVIKKER